MIRQRIVDGVDFGVGKQLFIRPVSVCDAELFRRGFGLEPPRKGVDVDAEPARVGELRHQAEIGEARCVAEAERTWLLCDQLLAGRKSLAIGPPGPGGATVPDRWTSPTNKRGPAQVVFFILNTSPRPSVNIVVPDR